MSAVETIKVAIGGLDDEAKRGLCEWLMDEVPEVVQTAGSKPWTASPRGGRRGWKKRLDAFDGNKIGGYAIVGPWIGRTSGKDKVALSDLKVGDYAVEKNEDGYLIVQVGHGGVVETVAEGDWDAVRPWLQNWAASKGQ
jgi:hypothetical protein